MFVATLLKQDFATRLKSLEMLPDHFDRTIFTIGLTKESGQRFRPMKSEKGSLHWASWPVRRHSHLFRNLLVIFWLLLAAGSQAQTTANSSPYTGPKGRETWAFRCVLDGQPRTLVLALHPELWLAYNTTTGHLWKTWSDGVKLDGTIYTTKHGPQPTSKGDALQRTETDQVWRITRNDKTETPKVQYLGHRFEKDGIVILTKLTTTDGASWTVEERPTLELVSAGTNGKVKTEPALKVVRRFTVSSKEQGAVISQYLTTGHQQSETDFQVSGGTFQKLQKNEVLQPKTYFGYSGWLTLAGNTPTIIYQSYPVSKP